MAGIINQVPGYSEKPVAKRKQQQGSQIVFGNYDYWKSNE
jgi:hypothetical protein